MFVVDFIAAFVLAFVLTIGFAGILRSGGYRRMRDFTAPVWLMSLASWLGGILIVAFGPALTGTHWLPFAVSGLVIGLLVVGLRKMPEFRRSVHTETGGPGGDARSVIAMYFIGTLLLFFCAISLRFYLAHLA